MARIRQAASYARRAPVREAYDVVLIVCEGSKTEPNYFKALRAAYRLSSANIAVVPSSGSDPMSVVVTAQRRMATAEAAYDRVFCVFDHDNHPNFALAVSRIQDSPEGQAGRWHAITSTPCFELWLLLHHQYSTAAIVAAGRQSACANAIRALRKYMPNYAKGADDIFEHLSSSLEKAIANGKKLHRHNSASGSTNPATCLHVLVEYLIHLKG